MKMMSMKMMAILGGMGLMGFYYLKNHPEMKDKMREMGKEASRMMYQKLDND